MLTRRNLKDEVPQSQQRRVCVIIGGWLLVVNCSPTGSGISSLARGLRRCAVQEIRFAILANFLNRLCVVGPPYLELL